MKKAVLIISCRQCPFHIKRSSVKYEQKWRCTLFSDDIEDLDTFPTFCKLPDENKCKFPKRSVFYVKTIKKQQKKQVNKILKTEYTYPLLEPLRREREKEQEDI